MSVKKNLKNSTVKPSKPGLLLFFIFFNAKPNSEYKISPSYSFESLSDNSFSFSPRIYLLKRHFLNLIPYKDFYEN